MMEVESKKVDNEIEKQNNSQNTNNQENNKNPSNNGHNEEPKKAVPKPKKLTPKKKRRLQQLNEKLAKEKERKILLEELQQITIQQNDMQYLRSSRQIGTKVLVKREQIKRALKEEKAGLPRTDPSIRLYQEKIIKTDEELPNMVNIPMFVFSGNTTIAPKIPDPNSSTVWRKKKRKRNIPKKKTQKKSFFTYDDISEEENSSSEDAQEDTLGEPSKKSKLESTESSNSEKKLKDKLKEKEEVTPKIEEIPKKIEIEKVTQMEYNNEIDKIDKVPPIITEKEESEDKMDKVLLIIPEKKSEYEDKAIEQSRIKNLQILQSSKDIYQKIRIKNQEITTSENKLFSGEEDAIMADINESHNKNTKSRYIKQINRTEEIERQRRKLPIIMEEQNIMEAIFEQDIVVICGQTGSGKTTQLPQFLYEAGFGSSDSPNPGIIGITEPRRVAAVSMASRVATEMNIPSDSDLIGYQIRYEHTVSDNTRIKFMTDGILLREIQSDFMLKKYSAIIIDEAHERSLNSDILLGLLSRIVPLRRQIYNEKKPEEQVSSPLKLIIMSATLRVTDFTENKRMFPNLSPRVITVESRQYPVTIRWNKVTPSESEVLNVTFIKVCKIHKNMPAGGILVFMTGQAEIEELCKLLRSRFGKYANEKKEQEKRPDKISLDDYKEKEMDEEKPKKCSEGYKDSINGVSEKENFNKTTQMEIDNTENNNKKEETEKNTIIIPTKFLVLPLYSMLSPKKQMKVFKYVDPNETRLVVVATNIAETSITIPGITYVVDSGRIRSKKYDHMTGMEYYKIEYTSKASSNQRAGRSGRTSPGICYRIYSSAAFMNHFPDFSDPEILQTPIDNVVLSMKNMGINKIESFPFPTPPKSDAIHAALSTLKNIGALNSQDKKFPITDLGKILVNYPISPRYAKMLVLGEQDNCLPYVITIVAALSVGNPFINFPPETDDNEAEFSEKDESKKEKRRKKIRLIKDTHSQWANPNSDLLSWLNAIGAYEFHGINSADKFCTQHYLHGKIMKEIRDLRNQLTRVVNIVNDSKLDFPVELVPPSREQKILLRQIITAGFVDQVARRAPEVDNEGREMKNRYKYIMVMSNKIAWIHSESFLSKNSPEYIVYYQLFKPVNGSKPFLKGITAIHPSWLVELGKPLIEFSLPLDVPGPKYDPKSDRIMCHMTPSYGPSNWTLPHQEMEYPSSPEKYRYFTRFFIEGIIIPELLPYQPYLVVQPIVITKNILQSQVIATVQPIMDHKIDTKKKLLDQLEKNPDFLLTAIGLWFDKSKHGELRKLWTIITKKHKNPQHPKKDQK